MYSYKMMHVFQTCLIQVTLGSEMQGSWMVLRKTATHQIEDEWADVCNPLIQSEVQSMGVWVYANGNACLERVSSFSPCTAFGRSCTRLARPPPPSTRRTLLFYLSVAPSSWTTNPSDWFLLDRLSFLRFHLLWEFLRPCTQLSLPSLHLSFTSS